MSESGAVSGRVCVGQIVGAHGVRGLVKLKSYTGDPADIVAYGPLTDETGRRRFAVALQSAAKDHWLACIPGVADRNAAEALRGTRLYVDRNLLPQTEEDEFYHADLIGLRVETPEGDRIGTVEALHDFGAGDVIEVRLVEGRTVMLPFTRAVVPVVDVAGGRLVAEPPPELTEPPGPEPVGGTEQPEPLP
jgi:16S rRNA processing protein RimM